MEHNVTERAVNNVPQILDGSPLVSLWTSLNELFHDFVA